MIYFKVGIGSSVVETCSIQECSGWFIPTLWVMGFFGAFFEHPNETRLTAFTRTGEPLMSTYDGNCVHWPPDLRSGTTKPTEHRKTHPRCNGRSRNHDSRPSST